MIMSIQSPRLNAGHFIVATARLSTPQLAQILSPTYKLSLDPRFPAPETVRANPPACFAPAQSLRLSPRTALHTARSSLKSP